MKLELIFGILIIVFFIILFIVTYIWNNKTPIPKGCENLMLEDEVCLACNKSDCHIKEDLINKINELKGKKE